MENNSIIDAKKALMIINPTAGKQTVKTQLFSVIEVLLSKGFMPTVVTTGAKGDATAFVRNMAGDYDMIICCGGDGTLNETITGVMESNLNLPIGYIPCGTTNDMANNLGLPKTLRKATEAVANGKPCYHDIGRFGDMAYFSYIASFGAFTKASYATPQTAKNLLGHFAYVLSGALELGNIKSYRVKLSYGDRVIEDDFIYVSVSNTQSFAGLFSFPKDKVTFNDGLFEILLIKTPKNVIDVSNIIHNISIRNFTDEKNMILVHTNSVCVETLEDVVWTIDGESSPKTNKVEINVVADRIQIYRPE